MYAADKELADLELISALDAISRVSAKLAKKLTILAEQSQSEEGVNDEEYNGTYRRTAECCCPYYRCGGNA